MLTPVAPFRVQESQRREVDRLIADGLLEGLLPGVVAPTGCTASLEVRAAVAALAVPERLLARVVLAQAAAAWVWCGGPPPAVVDVTVPPGRSIPRLPELAAHERRMPDQDVAVLPAGGGRSVQVTTATRTLVDLLRVLPEPLAVPAARPLAALPGVTAHGVAACLDRMPRARGVPSARRLAARLAFGPVSVDALAGDPVGVEDALHPADGGDHVVEVCRVRHLEGEP